MKTPHGIQIMGFRSKIHEGPPSFCTAMSLSLPYIKLTLIVRRLAVSGGEAPEKPIIQGGPEVSLGYFLYDTAKFDPV